MKVQKTLLALLAAVLCLPALSCAIYAENICAQELTDSLIITNPDGSRASAVLTDRNYKSKQTLAKDYALTIQSTTPISSLYLIWDTEPGVWELNTENETLPGGKNNFLHEFIALSEPSSVCSITLTEKQAVLCDIYAFSAGETPDYIQKWDSPYEKADLLILPTHADDEFVFFGGTIPYYAKELGYRVQVAYLTHHRARPHRNHELLNGLWHGGITAYPVISDFRDHYAGSLDEAKTIYEEEKILSYQIGLIRRFQPDVILGHDLNGEYGHGVHMLNASTLTKAVVLACDDTVDLESYARYGTWNTPKTYLHLYPNSQIIMNWAERPLKAYGGRTALDVAKDCFAFYPSQAGDYSVGGEGVYDCTKFGLYRSLVGYSETNGDFFENLQSLTCDPKAPVRLSPPQATDSDTETASTADPEPSTGTSIEDSSENPESADTVQTALPETSADSSAPSSDTDSGQPSSTDSGTHLQSNGSFEIPLYAVAAAVLLFAGATILYIILVRKENSSGKRER